MRANNSRLGFLALFYLIFSGLITNAALAHDNEQNKNTSELFSGLESEAAQAAINFQRALQAGDENGARNLLADNVIIFEGGGVERSAVEYGAHHLKADIAFLQQMKATQLEHQVKVTGDMAVSLARSKVSGRYKGRDINITSMETLVLRKQNAQWRIVHIHWSN